MENQDEKVIFLLDDDPFIQQIIPEVLNQGGFEVRVYHSFLKMMDDIVLPPSLCIVDFYLENMDGIDNGLDVINAIKNVNNEIPVILLSGMEPANLPFSLKGNIGGFRFIQKNHHLFEKLTETINELLLA
ncbi:MAG: response regulator [Bacteroidota bacterium]